MARKTIFAMKILAETLNLQKYQKTFIDKLFLEDHGGSFAKLPLYVSIIVRAYVRACVCVRV